MLTRKQYELLVYLDKELRKKGVSPSFDEMKDALGHVHIEDVPADGADEVLVPGTGAVDFAAVFAALDDVGYDGWLTVDLSGADMHPDDAAKQALEFLKQFDK